MLHIPKLVPITLLLAITSVGCGQASEPPYKLKYEKSPDLPNGIAFFVTLSIFDELIKQRIFTRHLFGAHDVRLCDQRAMFPGYTCVVVGTLTSHPQSECCNLRSTWINVDAMQIVSQHKTGNRRMKLF